MLGSAVTDDMRPTRTLFALMFSGLSLFSALAKSSSQVPAFPVRPEVFIGSFKVASEGITFNGEGTMFVGADSAVWIVSERGDTRKIADVDTHLGQAGIGARDILAADFGPKNVFRDGDNNDGIVWRITPDGQKTVTASGIADPNAVLVLPDRSFLVSDDGTDKIYRVKDGKVTVWSRGVEYPNGMALSLDNSHLYVAQIFKAISPRMIGDDRTWAFRLTSDFEPAGPPTVAFGTTEGGVDGLVADEQGRIYVADNGAGKIRRFDPRNGQVELIAEGMPGVASLVFGEGKFDRHSIYATSARAGGGKVWKVPVGARGAPVYR